MSLESVSFFFPAGLWAFVHMPFIPHSCPVLPQKCSALLQLSKSMVRGFSLIPFRLDTKTLLLFFSLHIASIKFKMYLPNVFAMRSNVYFYIYFSSHNGCHIFWMKGIYAYITDLSLITIGWRRSHFITLGSGGVLINVPWSVSE